MYGHAGDELAGAEDEAIEMSDEDQAMSDDDDVLVEEEILVHAVAQVNELPGDEAAAIEQNIEMRDHNNSPIELASEDEAPQQQHVAEGVVNVVHLGEAVQSNQSIRIYDDEAAEENEDLLDEFGDPIPELPTQPNQYEAAAIVQVNDPIPIKTGDEVIIAAFIQLFTQSMAEANANFCQIESLRRSLGDDDALDHDPDVPMSLHRVARTEAAARAALEEKIREARAKLDLQLLLDSYEAYWNTFGAHVSWHAIVDTAEQGTLNGMHPQIDLWIRTLVIDAMLDPEDEAHRNIIYGMRAILKTEFLAMCIRMKKVFDELTIDATNN